MMGGGGMFGLAEIGGSCLQRGKIQGHLHEGKRPM